MSFMNKVLNDKIKNVVSDYGYSAANTSNKHDERLVHLLMTSDEKDPPPNLRFLEMYIQSSLKKGFKPNAEVVKLFATPNKSLFESRDSKVVNIVKQILNDQNTFYQDLLKIIQDLGYKFAKGDFTAVIGSILTVPYYYCNSNSGYAGYGYGRYNNGRRTKQDDAKADSWKKVYLAKLELYLESGLDIKELAEYFLLKVYEKSVNEMSTRLAMINRMFKKSCIQPLAKKFDLKKLDQSLLDKAYKNNYSNSIEILQKHFDLVPTTKAVIECLKTHRSRSSISSYVRNYLCTFLIKLPLGTKLTLDQIDTIFSNYKNISNGDNIDGLLATFIKNQILDPNVHQSLITNHFMSVKTEKTLKTLVDNGFQIDQKVLEQACNQRNLKLVKLLVENYDIPITQKCLENSCRFKNNKCAINYLLEHSKISPSLKCIENYASEVLYDSTLSLLVKKFATSNQLICVEPIYDSDSE